MQVLNDETFAILVLMALFTTFITTPTVMAIYKPARQSHYPFNHRKLQGSSTTSSPPAAIDAKELRILACVHSERDAPSVINLIETVRGGGAKKLATTLKLYIMHLVELTERSSSIVLVRRFRQNGLPFRNPLKRSGSRSQSSIIAVAFEAYGQLSCVKVRPMTAVSSMQTMHEDVCNIAEEKKVSLLVVPFHKHKVVGSGDTAAMENVGHMWRFVNQKILKESPCSVAILVDRGLGGGEQVGPAELAREVCVLFFGGPDDREALELAGRMAEHPGVRATAVRFVEEKKGNQERPMVTLRPSPMKCTEKSYSFSTSAMDRQREKELDDEAISKFRQKTEGLVVRYEERPVSNVLEAVLAIGKSGEYELVVVGKGRFPSSMVAELASRVAEHPELGPIGDALASSHNGVVSSVLVIQQHDKFHSEETPVSMVYEGDSSVIDVADEDNHNSH